MIGGMERVEGMGAGQPVFVLFQSETLMWDMGKEEKERRRAGRRKSAHQERV